MALTWNGNAAVEVAVTTIAAAQLPGCALKYNGSGILAPAAAGPSYDALLVSEVVDATEANNRMYLFNNIDWSAYTRVGEASSVVKGLRGLTVMGLLMPISGAAIAAGDIITIDTVTAGRFKKSVTAGTNDIGIALDAIASTAVYSGRVHMYV